jgi:Domain of unknown function (DUF4157)
MTLVATRLISFRHYINILNSFQELAAKQDKSSLSSKQDEKLTGHSTFRRLSNLSNKQFLSYHLINSNYLQNSSQDIEHQFVPKPAHSSINFSFANVQTILKVSHPGDIYEQEADRIADRIMKISGDPEILPTKTTDNTTIDRKCKSCKQEEEEENQMKFSRKKSSSSNIKNNKLILEGAESEISNTLNQPGSPLELSTRKFMEPRLGFDFGNVRIHNDETSARSANAIDSLAYTIGNDVVFGSKQYQPNTFQGKKLLAHELTHVIQQRRTKVSNQNYRVLQRQNNKNIRSPVSEELIAQMSTIQGELAGRYLEPDETQLARTIFGNSIDYSNVRLIPTEILQYRTVGNYIRVPKDFTISNEYHAETFIHELTHVWQYQHLGTAYISLSLSNQILATLRTGSRNAAYDYNLSPASSFFDFLPEQQGLIVQNYYSMLRDQVNIAKGISKTYRSNHLNSSGNFISLPQSERQHEIERELPFHIPLISQMQKSIPRAESDLLRSRATEIIRSPIESLTVVPPDRQISPIKPLIEFNF